MQRGAAPYVLIGTLAAVALAAGVAACAHACRSVAAKRAEAQQVLSEVNGLNASLGRADELLNLANLRLTQVQRDIKTNRYELRSRSTTSSQPGRRSPSAGHALHDHRNSSLELILGAKSLDDILNQLDTETRVSSLDSQVIGQVECSRPR